MEQTDEILDFKLPEAIEILSQTPQTLYAMLSGLSDTWIFCNEGKDTFSAFDSVGNLIHGEKTDWMPRIETILNYNTQKAFEPFDRFAQFKNSEGKQLHQLLVEFQNLREQNIKKLKALQLTQTQLQLKGLHPALGEVTLKQLLATWTTHDLGHIAQICRVLAKQYKHEIGPWKAYLPIVNQ